MKPTKQKHGKENTIGKIIYGFLLFMPLLAIGITCGYAIFNKNAYKSYSNFNVAEENYVNVTDYTLEEGRTYKFISNNLHTNEIHSGYIFCQNVRNLECTRDLSQYDLSTITGFRLYTYNNNTILQFVATPSIVDITFNTHYLTFDFDFMSYSQVNTSNSFSYYFDNMIYENEIVNVTNTLDNVFYYSIDKVKESPLFNWANNTGTYNVLENTCNTLGITTTFIPMLLSYWLMISLMYLLYDIALLIVHMAHNRIHDIESSI